MYHWKAGIKLAKQDVRSSSLRLVNWLPLFLLNNSTPDLMIAVSHSDRNSKTEVTPRTPAASLHCCVLQVCNYGEVFCLI
jgi:hypothetical protein